MSVVHALLADLRHLGVHLSLAGETIRIEGPKDAVSEELLGRIRREKPALIAALECGDTAEDRHDRRDRHRPDIVCCHTCGGARFWRHALHGHVLCARCHPAPTPAVPDEEWGADPDPAGPEDWGAEIAPLVRWFIADGQHQIPAEPFQLTPWIDVTDPESFRDSLLFDIACGPDGPRNRYGAVADDLRRLYDQFQRGKGGTKA